MRYVLLGCTAVTLFAASLPAATGPTVEQLHCKATLLAEHDAVKPGRPFTVGLLLQADEHWHTYWQNPGESGMATRIQWTLPEGFEAGETQWPTPTKFVTDGPIVNFGYEGDVLLLVEITPPPEAWDAGRVTLSAKASWLVCDPATCVPGRAELTLELPVTDSEPRADAAVADQFAAAREGMPRPIERDRVSVQPAAEIGTVAFSIGLRGERFSMEDAEKFTFFPADRNTFEATNLLTIPVSNDAGTTVLITLQPLNPNNLPDRLRGVLKLPGRAYAIDLPLTDTP